MRRNIKRSRKEVNYRENFEQSNRAKLSREQRENIFPREKYSILSYYKKKTTKSFRINHFVEHIVVCISRIILYIELRVLLPSYTLYSFHLRYVVERLKILIRKQSSIRDIKRQSWRSHDARISRAKFQTAQYCGYFMRHCNGWSILFYPHIARHISWQGVRSPCAATGEKKYLRYSAHDAGCKGCYRCSMLTLREREKKKESVVERFGRRKAAKKMYNTTGPLTCQ